MDIIDKALDKMQRFKFVRRNVSSKKKMLFWADKVYCMFNT